MYLASALDTSSHNTAVLIPRVKFSSALWSCYHIYFPFGFPVKFHVCFSKAAFIWTCLNVGLHGAGREEATVKRVCALWCSALDTGAPKGRGSVLPQHPPPAEPWLPLTHPTSTRWSTSPTLLHCNILSKILVREHGLLWRSFAHFIGKILALGMISARTVSTQQFPKLMKTLDVAWLCVFISSNQQKSTMGNFRENKSFIDQIPWLPKLRIYSLAYTKIEKLPSAWFSDGWFTFPVTLAVVNSSKSQLKSNLWA